MGHSRAHKQPAVPVVCWTTASVEETRALAEQVGGLLKAGDVVALQGELGSGKTAFVQGLVKGAGVASASVKSPTFVLMREYAGSPSITHIDAYRLSGSPSAAWLDVEQLIKPEAITVIEWAQHLESLLPDQRIDLQLEHVSTHRRKITLKGVSQRSEQLRSALAAWELPSRQEDKEGPNGTVGD